MRYKSNNHKLVDIVKIYIIIEFKLQNKKKLYRNNEMKMK